MVENHIGDQRRVIFSFLLFVLSIYLNFAGFGSLLCLQTSINIEDGVGAASSTAAYATSTILGLVLTPLLLLKFETKYVLVGCSITYLLYVLANYFPEAYVLIPVGILMGIGEATMWPVMFVYVVHYAKQFASFGTKDTAAVITRFTGYFFFAYQLSETTGNLLSYAILYAGKTITVNEGNSTVNSAVDLSVCGANDCQYPNVTNANLNQYVPQSKSVLYAMIGVMAFLILLALGIMLCLVPKISLENHDNELELCPTESNLISNNSEKDVNKPKESNLQFTKRTLKAAMKQLLDPRQLLITPITLYSGLYMSFMFAEMPRAYSSCMLGVTQSGLCLAISHTCSAITSHFGCKLASKIGRTILLIAAFFIDIGIYAFLLFWVPASSTTWLVYVIFAVVGSMDGVWQPQSNEIHTAHFPENHMAFVIWSLWTTLGIAIQYGWSTSLCVYVKIYIQIGLLCFSMLCYGIAEFRIRKVRRRTHETSSQITI
uniref:protein unc-93 homolog A-like n=1 Tax=Ciona intestinalis TaxID=7719 RepID=UPI00089DC56F|nr:protein unc-93 homolog A-like [Ciona intestinalis]|eukprot:XP_004226179.3 protein unc-93 homolog A-like [Ciona intestinalis]